MFKYTKILHCSQEKHKFGVGNYEVMKINNSINCLKEKIACTKIRSRRNHKIIDDLQERLICLRNEFHDTKCLIRSGRQVNTSSVSVNTDCIIDVQNELRNTENKIQLLQGILCMSEDQISDLLIQLLLTGQKMKQSEKDRAQLQIFCAKAEIASLQYQIQENQEWLF
ncbi:unnamed protein product [Brugia pahangi]|uniref:Septicolysin n=1 Tax=Brugia pahangi TaxID=6280 RepID=A0A0N4T154_BRUPA|nr:unnamed protein product [Brugia pahangi]